MTTLNLNHIKETFERNFEFQGRTEKKALKDKIYMGLFDDSIHQLGWSNKMLKRAIDKGFIEPCYVRPNGLSLRKGYLYKGQEIGKDKARNKIEKLWLLLKNLI